MPASTVFHTHTSLADGLRELFKQLEERLSLRTPVNVYLAGGMAVHLYMADRVIQNVSYLRQGRIEQRQGADRLHRRRAVPLSGIVLI